MHAIADVEVDEGEVIVAGPCMVHSCFGHQSVHCCFAPQSRYVVHDLNQEATMALAGEYHGR